MSERVEIVEVGPRDGLQNEPALISVADKIALIDLLSRAGFRRIEAASFVSPKWVPQMAGSAEVMAGITRAKSTLYTALVPNLQGLAAAREAKADEIAVFASASEGFSRANLNASIADSLARFRDVLDQATMPVRGYVSCVVNCPHDGKIAPEAVADVAQALLEMGCVEVSLGDTTGHATPKEVGAMLDCVLQRMPTAKLAGHFHDTDGTALAAIDVSLDHGLRIFDASIGGLGGCPYAPGAPGNVSTRAVAAHLAARGFETGLDDTALDVAESFAQQLTHKTGAL